MMALPSGKKALKIKKISDKTFELTQEAMKGLYERETLIKKIRECVDEKTESLDPKYDATKGILTITLVTENIDAKVTCLKSKGVSVEFPKEP